MKKVGIIGGAGYTAGELIRLLLHHNEVVIDFIYSSSCAGNEVGSVHQDLAYLNTTFTSKINTSVDILFLCLGHGNSKKFLGQHHCSEHTQIIDLSNDFRSSKTTSFKNRTFIYGLPELQFNNIKNAKNIANPGCFATAIQLSLLPLAKANKLIHTIHSNAVTGATGAGSKLSPTSHYNWRDNNFSHYKAFNHQHLKEILEGVSTLQDSFNKDLLFIPQRGNFSRGIFCTTYTHFYGSIEEAKNLYSIYYKNSAFVKVVSGPLHLKQVVNTNFCFITLEKHGDILLVTNILDNLLKGASGQAVENMNIMNGWNQTEGLTLKANYF